MHIKWQTHVFIFFFFFHYESAQTQLDPTVTQLIWPNPFATSTNGMAKFHPKGGFFEPIAPHYVLC